jgi:hypothetical protein
LEGAESPAPDPAAQTPAAPENPNAPTAEKPGITIKTVKVTGLAPPELLLRLSRNSGSPLEVFSSLEIEELLVHSGKSAELGSVELLVPGATLTGLSCRPGGAPEGGTASPACTLAKIASGQGYGFGLVFTYPEPDYRLSLRMDVASYAVDALSVGGGDGTGTSGIKAADAIFNALEMSLSAAEGVLTVGVSVDTMHAQGLEGLYFAQATAIEGAGVFVDIGDDMLWQATADSFSAMGLDMREELSSEGARPGAHFVGQFYGEYGGGLLEALWPNWDSVLSQRYSAGSWRVDGFKASGGDGQRLEIRTAYASGPLTRGKLANSYLELSGVELEFPSDVWHDEYLVKTAEFLGTNVLKGDLRVWKAFDPENNTVRWAVNSLDVRDLGRAALDISVAGVKDATVEAFSGIRLRNIDRLLASVAAQDLGLGAIEISLSAQPVMDRLVIRTAEEKETIPSAALSEMASSVSMALLYVLTEHASVESTMAVTDAVVDFMKKPQIITVKTDPSSPLNAAAIAAWQQDPGSLVELLNLSVSSNEKLPVALEQ